MPVADRPAVLAEFTRVAAPLMDKNDPLGRLVRISQLALPRYGLWLGYDKSNGGCVTVRLYLPSKSGAGAETSCAWLHDEGLVSTVGGLGREASKAELARLTELLDAALDKLRRAIAPS